LIAVCKERQQLADALARYLSQLGMERRQKRRGLTELLQRGEEEEEEQGEEQADNRQADPAGCPKEEEQQEGNRDGEGETQGG